MTNAKKNTIYKTRGLQRTQPEVGEAVWGNGCERRGCLHPSSGVFVKCSDGVVREFCSLHSIVETQLAKVEF